MTVSAETRRGRLSNLIIAVLSIGALGVLLALGTWQVQRLHWKQDLIETIDERIHSEPHSLSDVQTRLTTTGDVEYWPVRATGVFHHEGERHFFATHKGQSGYFVYTPLELAEGRYVLVNRGFVPFELKDAATRQAGQVAGTVEVVGLARAALEGKPSFLLPDNDAGRNVFYWKDLGAMAATSGVGSADDYVAFFIDAGDAANPGGLPVGGVTIVNLPNSHLQYAITWYGLALALCGVLAAWVWRRRIGP